MDLVKRIVLSVTAAVLTLAGSMAIASSAQANDRELHLYYTHTKETIRIVYKSNGRFVQSALDRLNVFLRDWRRNEPARMDPALFDVLWEVYQRTGATQPIHIVSAYRSPATNAMLASNSSGVADNSQHMQGKAIDFFIPGVPVNRIRELGFLMQVGGVGYYPNSGSPFVHLDTGSVRAWPRMTTAQLQQLFPDGRTMHISSSGQTLPGYQVAKAEWDRCRRVPCNASTPDGGTRVASGDRPRTLWDLFTGGGNESAPAAQPSAPVQVASAPAPRAPVAAPQAVAATPAAPAAPIQQASADEPPAPPTRPTDLIAGTMVADAPAVPQEIPFQIIDAQDMIAQVAMASETDDAPMPPSISRGLAEMRATTPSAYAPSAGRLEVAATEPTAPTPIARPDFAPVMTASLNPQAISAAEPLEMRPSIDPDALVASQPHEPSELDAFASLFDGAVLPGTNPQAPDEALTNAVASLTVAEGQLFAPGLDTVSTLMAPTALSGDQFAFGTGDAMTGDDGDTVLVSGFTRTAALGHSSSTFGPAQTIWVHYDSASN
ncbi:DUF882 domain-containing protein [Pelagibacterium luteolum]|uniref:Murein endopeptidase K n=1 Tax=Pelagibacterium luteolum TaxID=440168 RepID=A0A1G7WUF2_9HYPH|nr:DUF882 domain-containing protein [Pelagibacterium luteolum]SDG75562.1 Uncharacterized conserved protein YcbK, DUF882 family [Pelagibacterium luteolum]